MTTATKKSAADARKGLKTERANLKVEILPNIALEEKGDWAAVTLEKSRLVPMPPDPKTGKDQSFHVHDVVFLEGSIETQTEGQDKVEAPLKANSRVSLKGNARLDRGFEKMTAGQSVLIEYLGKVEAGKGRQANDYNFDIIGA